MAELYKLEFPNGKNYIGLTSKTAEERFITHSRKVNNTKQKYIRSPLYTAWRKYGNPKLSTLVKGDLAYISDLEILAIKSFNSLVPHGYNLSAGGDISPMSNPEVVKTMRKTLKETFSKPDIKEKLSNAQKGRITSEYTKSLISQKLKGKSKPDGFAEKVKATKIEKGLVVSSETKAKQSLVRLTNMTAEERKLASSKAREKSTGRAVSVKVNGVLFSSIKAAFLSITGRTWQTRKESAIRKEIMAGSSSLFLYDGKSYLFESVKGA